MAHEWNAYISGSFCLIGGIKFLYSSWKRKVLTEYTKNVFLIWVLMKQIQQFQEDE